jgi:hypothetical protein
MSETVCVKVHPGSESRDSPTAFCFDGDIQSLEWMFRADKSEFDCLL